MPTILMLASQQLPAAPAPTADAEEAAAVSKSLRECSDNLQVLQELHAATCQFEALAMDRQQELLHSNRIAALISTLQWQLAQVLQVYLPQASGLQLGSEVRAAPILHYSLSFRRLLLSCHSDAQAAAKRHMLVDGITTSFDRSLDNVPFC